MITWINRHGLYGNASHLLITSAQCLLSLFVPSSSPNGSVGLIIPSRSARSETHQLISQPWERSWGSSGCEEEKLWYTQNSGGFGRYFSRTIRDNPYNWQLDVTEAIILGLDSIVIAGTGSGKTMPFMMPLLMDPTKKIIIVSPLKVLQLDQARN